MAEGIDEAAGAFAQEIAPQSRPRDQGGKFVSTTGKPEPMFVPREIEGDPLTGDTRDGGDDPRLRRLEKAVADGRDPDDSEVLDVQQDPEQLRSTVDDEDEPGQNVTDVADDGTKYLVTVDGAEHEVTLEEALGGYVRQETFHQRMNALNHLHNETEQERAMLQQNWVKWHKARRDYEEDFANIIPVEPNWDQLFETNPQGANLQRKVFETLYSKLNASRQARANREVEEQAEKDRLTHKFAVNGFTRFVSENIKSMPDKVTLDKNVASMRRTAAAAGFSEYEIATVYDHRMLNILLKASKYDRMMANKPKAIIPGKGKTLTPGAATPLSGNGRRSGLDDAQRRLASSGKIQDAVEVFRRML